MIFVQNLSPKMFFLNKISKFNNYLIVSIVIVKYTNQTIKVFKQLQKIFWDLNFVQKSCVS